MSGHPRDSVTMEITAPRPHLAEATEVMEVMFRVRFGVLILATTFGDAVREEVESGGIPALILASSGRSSEDYA